MWSKQMHIVIVTHYTLPNIQPNIKNSMNQTPSDLASESKIKQLLEQSSIKESQSHIRQAVENDDDDDSDWEGFIQMSFDMD